MRIMKHTVQGVSSYTIVRRDGFILSWNYPSHDWAWTDQASGAHYFTRLDEAEYMLQKWQKWRPNWA
jgi:hypothetical protein